MCFTHLCTDFVYLCVRYVSCACISCTSVKHKIHLKRRPWSIELFFYPPNASSTLHAETHSHIPRSCHKLQFECAQPVLIAAALNCVCDTSSGTGEACVLTFNMASDGRSAAEIATWFLETGSPTHARRRHSCWSLTFRSAPLRSARCRSSSARLMRGRRRVTSQQYCTQDVWSIGGKGKLGSVLKVKDERFRAECGLEQW